MRMLWIGTRKKQDIALQAQLHGMQLKDNSEVSLDLTPEQEELAEARFKEMQERIKKQRARHG